MDRTLCLPTITVVPDRQYDPSSYSDDPSIEDKWELWRRLCPEWVIWDENLNRKRPSSQAFQNHRVSKATSAFIGREVGSHETVRKGHPGYGVASFLAQEPRVLKQGICRDTLEAQQGHVLIFGPEKQRKKLAKTATIVIMPD